MTIKERIIKRLGGYTQQQYHDVCVSRDEIKNAYTWVKMVVGDFRTFTMPIRDEGIRLRLIENMDWRRGFRPIEDIKYKMARQITDKLMEDGAIKFDVEDNRSTDTRMFIATLNVLK